MICFEFIVRKGESCGSYCEFLVLGSIEVFVIVDLIVILVTWVHCWLILLWVLLDFGGSLLLNIGVHQLCLK